MSTVRLSAVELGEAALEELEKVNADKGSILGNPGNYTTGIGRRLESVEIELGNLEKLNKVFHTCVVSHHDFGGDSRHSANWKRATSLIIDFDGVPVATGRAMLDVLGCNYIVKFSSGHGIRKVEQGDRWHAIIPLDGDIETKKEWDLVALWIVDRFGEQADRSCRDMARCFFPGRRDTMVRVVRDRVNLSVEWLLGDATGIVEKVRYSKLKERAKEHAVRVVAKDKEALLDECHWLDMDLPIKLRDGSYMTPQEMIEAGKENYEGVCPFCGDHESRANPGKPNGHFFIPKNNKYGAYAWQCSSCAAASPGRGVGGAGYYNIDKDSLLRWSQDKDEWLFFVNKLTGKMIHMYRSEADDRDLIFAPADMFTMKNQCRIKGVYPPEVVPSKELRTVFASNDRYVGDNIINRYDATDIIKVDADYTLGGPPKEFDQVLRWAMGEGCCDDDKEFEESIQHFYRWLAHYIQKREKNITAYHMHGTEGTGKGMIFGCIEKIVGSTSCINIGQSRLLSNFNKLLVDSCFILVDEVNFNLESSGRIVEIIKQILTEGKGIGEAKGVDAAKQKTQACFFFFSNRTGAICLTAGDRRFNVGYRQEVPLAEAPWIKSEWGGSTNDFYWKGLMNEEMLKRLVAWLKTIDLRGDNANVINLKNGAWKQCVSDSRRGVKGMWQAIGDCDYDYFADRIGTEIHQGVMYERVLESLKEEMSHGYVSAASALAVYNYMFTKEGEMHKSRMPTAIAEQAREIGLIYNKKFKYLDGSDKDQKVGGQGSKIVVVGGWVRPTKK